MIVYVYLKIFAYEYSFFEVWKHITESMCIYYSSLTDPSLTITIAAKPQLLAVLVSALSPNLTRQRVTSVSMKYYCDRFFLPAVSRKQPFTPEQETRGHNIVADVWAGASNPLLHPNFHPQPTHTQSLTHKIYKTLVFFIF